MATTPNNIPQGYKATPLGIIPEEWEIYDFDKIVMRPQGRHLPNHQTHLRCIELEHLSQCDGSILGYIDSAEQKSMKNEFEEGDVLFGKLRPYLRKYWLAKFGGVCSTEIWVLRAISDVCTKEYLFNIVASYNFVQKANVSSGSKMPRAEWDFVSKIPILTPPLPEQEKIAEILSTWDKAIERQTQLIQKLELRKKGLMQQLLTGKCRLPGFSEPWKKVRLGEIFSERNEINKETLPLLSITAERGVILQSESDKRDISNEDKSKYKRICPNDIGYNTMRMWQGRCALSKLEGIVSPAYTIVIPNDNINPYYMEMLFKQPYMIYNFWTHSQGLVNDTLNCKFSDFSQVKVHIPPLQEQTAIANIFSSCDEEIRLAQDKLAAMKEQKKGLMQVLLTGKRRIIK